MRRVIYLLVIGLVFLSVDHCDAQMNRRAIKKNNKRIATYRGRKSAFSKDKAYSMIGLSVNALNYYGDLAPRPNRFSTDISFTQPAIGLVFAHRFGPRYTLNAQFLYGTLKGEDAESADPDDSDNGIYRYQRNLSFRNRIKELSVVASFDLFENMSTYISRVAWTPYAYAGVSVFHHNPQAQAPTVGVDGQPLAEAGEWVDLQPLGTEGQYADLLDTDKNAGIAPYKLVQLAIPVGVGVRFRLNQVMDFSAELGFRYLLTDYIDDVSKNYVDLDVFGDDRLAKAMSYRSFEVVPPDFSGPPTYIGRAGTPYWTLPGYGQEHPDNWRGDSNNTDIFMVTSLKLTYIIGKTFHRAKFR